MHVMALALGSSSPPPNPASARWPAKKEREFWWQASCNRPSLCIKSLQAWQPRAVDTPHTGRRREARLLDTRCAHLAAPEVRTHAWPWHQVSQQLQQKLQEQLQQHQRAGPDSAATGRPCMLGLSCSRTARPRSQAQEPRMCMHAHTRARTPARRCAGMATGQVAPAPMHHQHQGAPAAAAAGDGGAAAGPGAPGKGAGLGGVAIARMTAKVGAMKAELLALREERASAAGTLAAAREVCVPACSACDAVAAPC